MRSSVVFKRLPEMQSQLRDLQKEVAALREALAEKK